MTLGFPTIMSKAATMRRLDLSYKGDTPTSCTVESTRARDEPEGEHGGHGFESRSLLLLTVDMMITMRSSASSVSYCLMGKECCSKHTCPCIFSTLVTVTSFQPVPRSSFRIFRTKAWYWVTTAMSSGA